MKLPDLSATIRAAAYLAGGAAGAVLFVFQVLAWPTRLAELEAAQAAYRADSIPERVTRLERHYAPGVEYLVCRAVREDAGLDPRDCRERLREIDDYLRELR